MTNRACRYWYARNNSLISLLCFTRINNTESIRHSNAKIVNSITTHRCCITGKYFKTYMIARLYLQHLSRTNRRAICYSHSL